MSHIHIIADKIGDTIEYIYFCSDFCNENYCNLSETYEYQGWCGGVEQSFNELCENCNKPLRGIYGEHSTEQTNEEWEEWKKEVNLNK